MSSEARETSSDAEVPLDEPVRNLAPQRAQKKQRNPVEKFLDYLIMPRRWAPGDPLHTTLNYEWARMINREYFRFFHSARFRGLNNIPRHGPIIFAPNHNSYYDPTLVACGIPSQMRFMAWDALFNVPIVKQILSAYGAYPVRLQAADKGSIERTLRILKSGQAVMIFPEGARCPPDQLGAFEQGVARMALQTGASIVPVTITGMERAWPLHFMLPRLFHPLTIKYHPAIRVTITHDRATLRTRLAEMNELIATPIRRRLTAYFRLQKRVNPPTGVWLAAPPPPRD